MNVKLLDKIEAIRAKRLVRLDADGDWDEGLHPRAKNGQFSKVAGSGSGAKTEDDKEEYDRVKKEYENSMQKKVELLIKVRGAKSKEELEKYKKEYQEHEKNHKKISEEYEGFLKKNTAGSGQSHETQKNAKPPKSTQPVEERKSPEKNVEKKEEALKTESESPELQVKKEYDKVLKEWENAQKNKTDLQKKLNNASSKEEVQECVNELGKAEKEFQECDKKLAEQNKKMMAAGYVWNEKKGDFEKPSKTEKQTEKKAPEKASEKKEEITEKEEKKHVENKASEQKEVRPEPERKRIKAFDKSSYQAGRKDSAFTSSDPAEVDKAIRPEAGRVWNGLTHREQETAIFYTRFSSGMFNDKQREAGLKGDFSAQSRQCEELTRIVDRSSYDFDMMLYRGNPISGASKFLDVPEDLLKNGEIEELEKKLIGLEPTEHGWASTGAAKGYGCTPKDDKNYVVQYNIFAPAGTKMLYCEPFSWYNNENKDAQMTDDWWDYNWWDGKSEQKASFSREFEMLLQRNTKFRVTGVKRENGVLWIDMDVIGQGVDE